MSYHIQIEPNALTNIQEITNWYNEKQSGLGNHFQTTTIKQIEKLSLKPHICAIRYNQIRCLIIKKFPYMVHFYINEETKSIEILAIISTDRNPNIWQKLTKRK